MGSSFTRSTGLSVAPPGVLSTSAAHSIVITEEDYIKFLLTITKEREGIPRQIVTKLKLSCLLFLGYSLEDWDFRTLYKGMIETLKERDRWASFAIQRYPTPFWVDYWANKRIKIYDVDLYEFSEDLGLALGIDRDPFLGELCKVFGLSTYEVVSERRRSGWSWPEYAEKVVREQATQRDTGMTGTEVLPPQAAWLRFRTRLFPETTTPAPAQEPAN